MSESTLRLPGLSDDETAILNRLLTELRRKTSRNQLRASYYDGKRAITQLGYTVPPQYKRLNLVLGWAKKSVDLLARRCNLERFVWPDGDLEALGMRAVWDGNHFATEVSSAAKSALIHGVSFLVTTRGEVGAGEPEALVHAKDALNATGDWNSRARRMDNLLSVIEWGDDGDPSSLALYLDGLTISAYKENRQWTVERDEHSGDVPVEALVYQPVVGRRPFGSSRISRPIMSLQDQAVREAIRLEAHMDVYAIPEMWMLGADMSIFKNADGSQKMAWDVMLGRIKGIPDAEDVPEGGNPRAEVKQFPASSPEPHLAALNAFAKQFAREASLPDTALAITDVANPTSAESYDSSQYELIAEAEGATEDWTPALVRTVQRALAIMNGEMGVPDKWQTIDAQWRNPRYLARSAAADAGLKQLTAVPWLAETEVGLELLGLDDQQIRRALAERRRAEGSQALQTILQRAAARQNITPAAQNEPVSDDDGSGGPPATQ